MKNWLKQIIGIILLVSFLVSTTGFILYNSYCSCTGNSTTSVVAVSETCSYSNDLCKGSDLKEESCCSSYSEQVNSQENIGRCNTLDVRFVKLKENVIHEIRSFIFSNDRIEIVKWNVDKERLAEFYWNKNTLLAYIEPPPKFINQNDYLNLICQLKLPEIA
ncbi:MAG: hypothetical protein HQ541_07000 [Mariniphaga sp.]|nr:hypothetical protein [Mariniphaga sp.]